MNQGGREGGGEGELKYSNVTKCEKWDRRYSFNLMTVAFWETKCKQRVFVRDMHAPEKCC